MINSITINTLIREFEEEQNKLTSELTYERDEDNKMKILKHLTIINSLMKSMMLYDQKYINPPIKQEIKIIKNKKLVSKTEYGIKKLLN
jgi:hypothetical protein